MDLVQGALQFAQLLARSSQLSLTGTVNESPPEAPRERRIVPAECEDGARLRFELRLRDEQETDFRYTFTATVDQRFQREYERSRPTPSVIAAALAERPSLFEEIAELGVAEEARRRYVETKAEESVTDDKISRDDINEWIKNHLCRPKRLDGTS